MTLGWLGRRRENAAIEMGEGKRLWAAHQRRIALEQPVERADDGAIEAFVKDFGVRPVVLMTQALQAEYARSGQSPAWCALRDMGEAEFMRQEYKRRDAGESGGSGS